MTEARTVAITEDDGRTYRWVDVSEADLAIIHGVLGTPARIVPTVPSTATVLASMSSDDDDQGPRLCEACRASFHLECGDVIGCPCCREAIDCAAPERAHRDICVSHLAHLDADGRCQYTDHFPTGPERHDGRANGDQS